jgi:ribosomal protein S12 methylthiotransferase
MDNMINTFNLSEGHTLDAPGNIGFISLGCPKNTVDSERIITQLRAEGYNISPSYDNADVVIVNTCGFIDSAVKESLDTIGEALRENGKVLVTGCLGAKENEIREVHPNVLAVTGPHAYEEVVKQVHEVVPPAHDPFTSLVPDTGIKLTPKHYAYLKISEGCNHRCSFCIIPSFRGDLVSRPISQVLKEAESLVNSGTKELLVISQDTSAYGVDTKYRQDFWKGREIETRLNTLSEELGQMGAWIRMHYVYPYPHVDDIIPLMAENKILPYLDIPFQHASHAVLKNMKRPAHAEKVLNRIHKWRDICPDITLRSTFIVGFPGETEADFQELLDFLEEAQLDRVGAFEYSNVDGAAAANLPNHIDEAVKKERYERFMAVQQRISAAKLQSKVGTKIDVIVDEVVEEGAVARSKADAPDIDGQVFLDNQTQLKPGDILTVEVEEADEYDLWAHPV